MFCHTIENLIESPSALGAKHRPVSTERPTAAQAAARRRRDANEPVRRVAVRRPPLLSFRGAAAGRDVGIVPCLPLFPVLSFRAERGNLFLRFAAGGGLHELLRVAVRRMGRRRTANSARAVELSAKECTHGGNSCSMEEIKNVRAAICFVKKSYPKAQTSRMNRSSPHVVVSIKSGALRAIGLVGCDCLSAAGYDTRNAPRFVKRQSRTSE